MTEPTYRLRVRDEILAHAVRVLQREGLDALQARRLAVEAKCSVGTIYNVFGDIDGLIVACNGQTLGLLGDELKRIGQQTAHGSMRERLMALAQGYVQFSLANGRRWEAVFKHRWPEGAEIPPFYLAEQQRLLSLIEDVLVGQIAQPDRRASAARALFGAVHGVVALAIDNRLGGRLRPELEQQIAFIVDLLAAGLERNATRP